MKNLAKATLSPLSVSYKSPLVVSDLLNALPEAVITADPNFKITGLNPVAEAIYGMPLKDAIGQSLFELINFEIVGLPLHDALKSLFEHGFWAGDIIFYTKDKQRIYFNSRCTLMKDEAGKVSSIVLVNHNISEKIQQDRELAQIENKYQTVVESLSEGVMLINADGTVSTANRRAKEILGLTDDEATGLVVASPKWKATREDNSEFPLEEFPAIVTLKTGVDTNDTIMGVEQSNGTKIWLSINTRAIYKDGHKSPDAVISSFKDITAIKVATEKLQKNEVMFRSFMCNSHNLGWVYDKDGNLVYGNPVLMETVGLTQDAIGKNIYEVTNRRVAAAILDKNKKVLETGEVIISEDRFVDKFGQTRYFIAHYFLLTFGDDQKFVGGHALDITERKKMQAELVNEQIQRQKQINQATLEAQEEERDRISGELHDNVNQLLMSSKLHINVAKKATENQEELLDKATDYLMMAIEEIRALSRTLNSSVVSTVGLVSSVNDIAKNLEQLNNIKTSIDFSQDAIDVLSDEQQLMIYRIVQEQSNNIIKYADATATNFTLKKVNKYIQLTIADNGKGFDKEKTELKGIGLINIFNRVDAYNGRVKIESTPGNGVTLKIIFPFAG
ncbi:PAS domain S-box protein [Ferruginibacter sp. SUN002]|uniref:sensor histidine kinase n=1 Tax=Ferruginibacter sp. SUN002 TaxID=2937789 RepID=UPI003D35E24D